MGDVDLLRRQSMEVQADIQAFDYARSKAGDVTELFDVLAGKLRPERNAQGGGDKLGGTSMSSKSILKAHYHGSSGSTVLGMANLKRIQTFLDEPQKHLGQVIADIEKEAGSFYGQVSSRTHGSGSGSATGNQRMQRGALETSGANEIQRVCLEDVPEMNKYLGPSSRFGDGDGSFWDRWLTTTGHFTAQGNYAKADMPSRSMYSTGVVTPHSGFKRYQLDKLAFTREPTPRVLTYAQRRELGDCVKADETPKRLRGAYSETSLGLEGGQWLNGALLGKATEAFRTFKADKAKPRTGPEGAPVQAQVEGEVAAGRKRTTRATSSGEDPEVALADVEQKIRTLGTAGTTRTLRHRSAVLDESLDDDADQTAVAGETETGSPPRISSGDASRLEKGDFSLKKAIASLGLVHPNYFGRRARTHVYNYYKQVSRRRHQYGHPEAMAFTPLAPLHHVGAISPYEAGIDAIASDSETSLDDSSHHSGVQKGKGKTRPHQLPPLATSIASTSGASGGEKDTGSMGSRQSVGTDGKSMGDDRLSKAQVVDDQHHVNLAHQGMGDVMGGILADCLVNLAHQGMGDVMGGILADCLVGLPLMKDLNLRDNRLTDKGLMPIVKAARELALYFSDRKCTLAKLVLSKADASNFVKHMKTNKTLTYLDLSHNLIGSQESINYVRPEFYTGAEALADWISTGSCPLTYLDISWNTIRLDSAVYFGNAVAYATDLKELDLSFNCFGEKGGEAVGASLHLNTSLKTLRFASNAVNPRACFVICQGLMQNSTIRDIDLSNNSLGKVGVGCVMALPAEVGDNTQIRLAHCNFMVGCESCWFDDEQLRPSYDLRMDEPYDRAVAFHLIRRAARDEGLKLKRVAHTMAGESERQIHLVVGSGREQRDFAHKATRATREAIFRKYDQEGTGSLGRSLQPLFMYLLFSVPNITHAIGSEELAKAFEELGLSDVDMVMTQHGNGNGRIDESEFHEFVEESIVQHRRREGRSKAFLAEESSISKPWMVPPEGHLRLELEYQRLHNQGSHTSLESTDSLLAMLSSIGDGHADVVTHALGFVSLNVQQGLRMYTTLRTYLGGDKIKALTKVIPRMESSTDARLLKNFVLRGLDERRKLRHELGPAYRPLMGTPMGHFELDLAKPMHRLAALKAGTLEIDFASSTRPPSSRNAQGQVAASVSKKKPMNTMKFQGFMRAVGLGDEETWDGVLEEEGELDRVMDKALHKSPPQERTRKVFEHLHFLYAGERGHGGAKEAIPTRPSAMDKLGNGNGNGWVSKQCRFIVLAIQEAYDGDEFLQDIVVDFVVTVYPRIVDVYDFLKLVGCLEDRSQAFVIKRVGWLAAWNACRPEGYMEMALDLREERQIAKVPLVVGVNELL
eukprot:g12087.t1